MTGFPPPSSPSSLSSLAIRRHIGTLMLTVAIAVVGLIAVTQMPVDLLPSITYPRIGVRADVPGVLPDVAVNEVTRPLEEAMAATEGVTQIFSQTREGRVSIDLFFEPGADVDQALNDATATLNRARNTLPDTVEQPRLFKFDPSQLPVYELALTSSSLQPVDLRVFADEDLARELIRVPGVANVDISGGVREEIQVNVDLQRLQALGLPLTEISETLAQRNQDTAGGLIRGGRNESLTRLLGRFQTAEDIRQMPINVGTQTAPQGILLADVADVVDGTEEQRLSVTLNQQPAVKVSVQKQPEANTVRVVDGVKAKLAELQQSGQISDDVDLVVTLDESRFIRSSIRNVAIAGLTGSILAGITVFLFLGSLRQTAIIMLAIPLATLMAMILMRLFNLSLNVFSLGGLALGVGIVVDNSIVMLETIAKTISPDPESEPEPSGPDSPGNGAIDATANGTRIQAAVTEFPTEPQLAETQLAESQLNGTQLNGTQLNGAPAPYRPSSHWVRSQIEHSCQSLESALVASTTTNLVAVLPFLLIGGFLSLIFSELVWTISFAVAASLLIALTVVPALASRLLVIPMVSPLSTGRLHLITAGMANLTQQYGRLLKRVLRIRGWVIGAAILIFGGGSLWIAPQLSQEILPQINTGLARLSVRFPTGTPVEDNRKIMQAVDQILLAQPETEAVFTTSGGMLFSNITVNNALRGTSTITLQPESNVAAFVDRINTLLRQDIPVVDISMRARADRVRGLFLGNSPTRDDIDILLQGREAQPLAIAGERVLEALASQAVLARYEPDAAPPQPEVKVLPDWQRVTDLGLSAETVGDTIRTALSGTVPTQLQRGDRLVNIRVQLPPGRIQQAKTLRTIPLFTDEQQPIQLGDVATIATGPAPGEIQRINQREILLIEGSLTDGASLSAALQEVEAIMATVELPAGVSRLPSNAAATNRQLQRSLQLLGGLAIFLVFVVMAVQYNSLIDPLVILFTVPLALTGGLLGLFLTDTPVGATVVVGTVLLVGIVVNNGIIMVELANQIRQRDRLSPAAAILQAASQRLRPILMTTLTTVLGLLPLALGLGEGSEFLQPLGIVVFYGLSLSTLLTLIIIPCVYTLLHDLLSPRVPLLSSKASGPHHLITAPHQSAQDPSPQEKHHR